MRLGLLGVASIVLAGSLTASRAEASPEDVLGFGPRSIAMGGVGVADAKGFEAVYGNPALLSLAHERELTLGLVGAAFDLHAGTSLPYGALHGSLIGATVPIPFGGALRDRVTVGLGFFTPFDLVVRGRILYPEKPQFPLADRTQSVAVQAGLGLDLGYGFRLGGGFAALAALSGSVLVATDASGRIGTVVEDTLVASYGPIVGASYDISDDYRVGLTFRGELVGRFDVVITVRDLGQIVVPPLHISGIAQYDPWQIGAEVARVRGPWRAAIGATFKHWSAYPGAADATVRCPFGEPGSGVGVAPCEALVPPDPGYSDTLSVHAGVERVIDAADDVTMSLRGGYFFEPSPAPEQTGVENVFDSDRSAFSLGYGVSLGGDLPPLSLDMFAQLQLLHPRTHAKDAGGEVATGGTILAAGTTVGARF